MILPCVSHVRVYIYSPCCACLFPKWSYLNKLLPVVFLKSNVTHHMFGISTEQSFANGWFKVEDYRCAFYAPKKSEDPLDVQRVPQEYQSNYQAVKNGRLALHCTERKTLNTIARAALICQSCVEVLSNTSLRAILIPFPLKRMIPLEG